MASFPEASSGGGLVSFGYMWDEDEEEEEEEEESEAGSEEERGEGERATAKDDELRSKLV